MLLTSELCGNIYAVMLLDTPLTGSKSETETSQNSVSHYHLTSSKKKIVHASRYSVDYWRTRLFRRTYDYGSERREIAEWYVQIQHAGRREKIPLNSNNKEEAARQAKNFYERLRATNWDTARKEFCPRIDAIRARSSLSLGDYLKQVQPLLRVRPRTAEIYAYALRKIAREATGAADRSKARFHPKSHEWRRVSDQIPLAELTPAAINGWKDRVMAVAGTKAKERERAGRNINSFIRNARALFSRNILARLKEMGVKLPKPLPFEDVTLEASGKTRYESTIDVRELLKNAKTQLQAGDTEAWKVILLALGAGLRRAEIDFLRWDQLDFKESLVRVLSHGRFEAKTQDSEGSVYVDQGLLAELKKLHPVGSADFVVGPELKPGATAAVQYYRCASVFGRVTAWLRQQGVKGNKPLHTLRKEFGSIICACADIHAASRQLRHSNLSTTAAYYVDNRRRVSVPLAAYLADEEIQPAPPSPAETVRATARRPATAPISAL